MYVPPNDTHSFCLPSLSSHQMWFLEDSKTEFLDRRACPGALGFPRLRCARDTPYKDQNLICYLVGGRGSLFLHGHVVTAMGEYSSNESQCPLKGRCLEEVNIQKWEADKWEDESGKTKSPMPSGERVRSRWTMVLSPVVSAREWDGVREPRQTCSEWVSLEGYCTGEDWLHPIFPGLCQVGDERCAGRKQTQLASGSPGLSPGSWEAEAPLAALFLSCCVYEFTFEWASVAPVWE